jgi:hypothetical protein
MKAEASIPAKNVPLIRFSVLTSVFKSEGFKSGKKIQKTFGERI